MNGHRGIPEDLIAPPPLTLSTDLTMDLEVRVMTLLYGGGVEAGHTDGEMPFRAPSIRGQLRYWWRAARGGDCADWRELKKRESKIWGSTDQVSAVRISVHDQYRGSAVEARNAEPRYALFPASQTRDSKPLLYRGGRFRLHVETKQECANEVHTALWAWFTFGGIGARTRRGAGALFCPNYAYSWDAEHLTGSEKPRDWSVLKGGLAVMGIKKMPWQRCWEQVVNLLRDFRQDRNGPRGRSRWPEPDEIRVVREQWDRRHGPQLQGGGFPRAALGATDRVPLQG